MSLLPQAVLVQARPGVAPSGCADGRAELDSGLQGRQALPSQPQASRRHPALSSRGTQAIRPCSLALVF